MPSKAEPLAAMLAVLTYFRDNAAEIQAEIKADNERPLLLDQIGERP
jgi:hypothetical protein